MKVVQLIGFCALVFFICESIGAMTNDSQKVLLKLNQNILRSLGGLSDETKLASSSSYEDLDAEIFEHEIPFLPKTIPENAMANWAETVEVFVDLLEQELSIIEIFGRTKILIPWQAQTATPKNNCFDRVVRTASQIWFIGQLAESITRHRYRVASCAAVASYACSSSAFTALGFIGAATLCGAYALNVTGKLSAQPPEPPPFMDKGPELSLPDQIRRFMWVFIAALDREMSPYEFIRLSNSTPYRRAHSLWYRIMVQAAPGIDITLTD